jgi:general nucleoside transport system ATP-binding protein
MEITLREIRKNYGLVKALRGVDLSLRPGRIYGLLGENGAGKSTLMRVLCGRTRPDGGAILIDGQAVNALRPAEALSVGVGMLQQDPLDFPAMKVWENFSLGGKGGGREAVSKRLDDLAGGFHFAFDPDARLADLTVGERQQLSMLRLLDAGVRVLILDEPTTGISLEQKEALFAAMRRLAGEKDRTVILVTHNLEEAVEMCDDILIMRQGKMVGELTPPYSKDAMLEFMFGESAPPVMKTITDGAMDREPVLALFGATFEGEGFDLENVSLTVRPGEIIGLAGLEGNGQEPFLRGLAGRARLKAGKVVLGGQDISGGAPERFRGSGSHLLPAARLEQGLFPDMSVREHFQLAIPSLSGAAGVAFMEESCKRFRLPVRLSEPAVNLSGGNQQRLQLALIPEGVKLLLLEHPTRGLDLESCRQIWGHLEERCRQGAAILFSSADLEEILDHSHRALIFFQRRLFADVDAAGLSVNGLGALMSGQRGRS